NPNSRRRFLVESQTLVSLKPNPSWIHLNPVGSNPIPVGSNPIPVGSDPIPRDFNPNIQRQFQKVPGGIPNFGVPQTQPQLVPTQFPTTPPQIPPFPDSRPPEPPEVAVFPKHPVEDEEPNILICSVTKFWPAALGVTWLRNGAPVTRGVLETPIPAGPRPIPGDSNPVPASGVPPAQSQLDLTQFRGISTQKSDPNSRRFLVESQTLVSLKPNPSWIQLNPVGSNPIPVGSDPIPGDFNPNIRPQFQKVPGGIPNFGVPQTQSKLDPTQSQLDPTQFQGI
uniref:Ig-like domain-containing protein n=1 Tax=Taeniopygia guttata TaxID=59729 RepID=A0A674H563_TAEGU